jgi:hypothetical protein
VSNRIGEGMIIKLLLRSSGGGGKKQEGRNRLSKHKNMANKRMECFFAQLKRLHLEPEKIIIN